MSALPGASELRPLLGAEVRPGRGGDDVGASGFLRWLEGRWRGRSLPVVGTATRHHRLEGGPDAQGPRIKSPQPLSPRDPTLPYGRLQGRGWKQQTRCDRPSPPSPNVVRASCLGHPSLQHRGQGQGAGGERRSLHTEAGDPAGLRCLGFAADEAGADRARSPGAGAPNLLPSEPESQPKPLPISVLIRRKRPSSPSLSLAHTSPAVKGAGAPAKVSSPDPTSGRREATH